MWAIAGAGKMKVFGRNVYWPWNDYKRFMGNWDWRLSGIFDCDVDYSGKTILDAGCNIGMIDYEISKRSPSFVHGIDDYRAGISAARHIFQGVDVPSRFDVADLGNDRRLRKLLMPSYDVILLMSVWHQVEQDRGSKVSDRLVATLTERCSGVFVAKNPARFSGPFTEVMRNHGFRVAYDGDPLGRLFTYVCA
jgi:2-polyprenyl-3-methyl-5-hydroxy-6-metoxy-1,4-benzoquinol methylase